MRAYGWIVRALCAAVVAFSVDVRMALAGAWGLTNGEISVEMYNSSYQTDTDLDRNGERIAKPNNGEYKSYTTELKLETYTPIPDLNFLFALPFRWATYKDDNVDLDNAGFSDTRVGLKYILSRDVKGSRVFAVSGELQIPTGDTSSDPVLGKDQYYADLRVLFGQSFLPKTVGTPERFAKRYQAFVVTELGYRRWEDSPGQVVYLAQGRSHLGAGFSLQGEVDGVEAVESDGESYTVVRIGPAWKNSNSADPVERSSDVTLALQWGEVVRGENTSDAHELVLKLRYVHQF